METTTTVERSAQDSSSVRANINERKFFASMKHLFASSFSVIGELLQNSRRAKASVIRIRADFHNGTLAFEDDGIGIDNFAKLVEMSASGWDDETMLKETPFGMGFFSCFTAAERVEVESKGKLLSACLDDVVNGDLIEVVQDPDQPANITTITLRGVSKEIFDASSEYAEKNFLSKIAEIVKGFDLPVYVNGIMIERPHAKENIGGEETEIGLISIVGLHRGNRSPVNLHSADSSNAILYLQGLPIKNTDRGYHRGEASIIHLDNAKFIAQMPDRIHLYDERIQLQKVDEVVKQVLARDLLQRKAELSPKEFVCNYWQMAKKLQMLDVMNDIDLVPQQHFNQIESASISTEDQTPFAYCGVDSVFTKEDIASGKVRIWTDAPDSANDDGWSQLIMKLMQRENIYGIDLHEFDENHWIHKHTLNANGLKFRVNPRGESRREECFTNSNVQTTVVLAESVEIIVTSAADDDHVIMYHTVTNDWLIAPLDQETQDTYDCAVKVWVIGDKDESPDHPVNALNTFYEDHHYREEWENDAKLDWETMLANLRNEHTIKNVQRVMAEHYLDVSEDRVGDFGIVRVERHHSFDDSYGRPKVAFDVVDKDFMENLTVALQQQTGIKDIDSKQVTRALLTIVRPDLRVGGPRDGDHIGQW